MITENAVADFKRKRLMLGSNIEPGAPVIK